jgi:hypothetical protein
VALGRQGWAGGRWSPITTRSHALDRPEVITTGLAFAVSATLYVARAGPYLARGVVGDVLGLGLLAVVVIRRRRRRPHEALVRLICIGAVLIFDPDWPLLLPEAFWWTVVVVARWPRTWVCAGVWAPEAATHQAGKTSLGYGSR